MKKSGNRSDLLSESEVIQVTFTDRFIAFTFRLLKGPSLWLHNKMPGLREDILKSNITMSPEALISLVFFFTFISLIPAVLGIFVALYYGWIFGIFLLPIPPLVFALGILTPKMSQSSRAGALEHELPFVIGYMTTLAGGGISPFVTLKRLSTVDLYPATAKEAKRILMDIEVFGMDPISALDKAANNIPNKSLADFLGGYTSVLKSGGDVVSYMETKLRDTFSYRTIKMKSATETIGTFAEAYITLAVILGISFFVLFAIQAILGGGGLMGGGGSQQSLNNVVLFSTVFIPLISALFIYIVHSVQPREPFTYHRPYLVFSASTIAIPIAVAIPYLLPMIPIPFHTMLGIGLIISVIPASIVSMKYMSHKKGVEKMLPSFLNDIAEVRKTGLSPERCIEQLAERKYDKLSSYVKNMSTQLSWGVPLRKVMINFSSSVKSWLVRAMAFILLEVVDVGGGTVKMFGSLADFSQKINETEKERRSALRPYIFIPYFGAIMVVVTMIMMLYFVTLPLTTLPGYVTTVDLPLITTTLLSSAILEAWIMGFVAGKMGEGNIAAGFKHSAILVVMSLIAIYITYLFLPMPA